MTRVAKTHGPPPRGKRAKGAASAWSSVYKLVARIPRGRVMSYGQISRALGARLSPLAVGWALHVAPPELPWHRVVCANGELAVDRRTRGEVGDEPQAAGRQRQRLAAEGVRFDARGRVRMAEHTQLARRRRSTIR